jgi:hypothetical protein
MTDLTVHVCESNVKESTHRDSGERSAAYSILSNGSRVSCLSKDRVVVVDVNEDNADSRCSRSGTVQGFDAGKLVSDHLEKHNLTSVKNITLI